MASLIEHPVVEFEAYDAQGVILATAGLQLDGSWAVWRVGTKMARGAHDLDEAEELVRGWGAKRIRYTRANETK